MSAASLVPCAALLLVACAGASGHYEQGLYRDGGLAFRVGALPPAWTRVRIPGQPLAFHHAAGGTIVAGASCDRAGDASLAVLTNHLLFGVEQRREHARLPLTLDGRLALRTQLDGTVDGVPVALDLVVVSKNGCTYDLQLAAAPRHFAARQPDFERFFRSFALVSAR